MRLALLLASLAGLLILTCARESAALPEEPRSGRARADHDALRGAAMNDGGDAKRGQAIYLSAAAQCAACHKAHGQGGDLGPDLSQVGGKLDRTHLIESILDPSAEILQGYHT